ncbi:MAG: hypothetical protein WKF43_14960 [Acidimicrobiales bacterium]
MPRTDPSPELPPEAWLVALAGLPMMGPARLLALSLALAPETAWEAVLRGRVLDHAGLVRRMGARPADVAGAWRRAAVGTDVNARWRDHAPVVVAGYRHRGFPSSLADDLEPPAVLFMLGDERPWADLGSPWSAPDDALATASGWPPRSATSWPGPA